MNNPKNLKSGDLVYCYTDRNDSGCMPFKQTYFKPYQYYEIVIENNRVCIKSEEYFSSDFYYFQDYFLTMSELREQKLKRLI
jgi:hypothetical protein